jgi:26S proteasome regulatory subunit N8
MFRKVNAKERVVGFYSTGPQIRPNDLRIHDICERFCSNSVFCIIDVRADRPDLPVNCYKVVEQVSTKRGQRVVERTFAHVPSSIEAVEAEEVGVEHLLRDINDPTVSTVASLIKGKMAGLATLHEKLLECKAYLESVARDQVKVNPEIVANLQIILNLLPNLNNDLVQSMIVKTNDMHMAIYLASLIRSVIALHDLINNKIRYGEDGVERQKEEEKKEEALEEKKRVADEKKKAADEKGEESKSSTA